MGFFDIFKKKEQPKAVQSEAEVQQEAAREEQKQEELNAGLERTKTGLFSKLARAVAGRSTVDME